MAYKFRMGKAQLSGAATTDDVGYFADPDTLIDWEQDYISFKTNNTDVLTVSGSKVGIGTTNPHTILHVSASRNGTAATFVGDVYITGSTSKLVVEETSGTDYRVVIDPNNGPLIQFGSDTSDTHYMTIGAYSSLNNIDTETRDFHLFGSTTTAGFYFDESLGRFGMGTTSPDEELHVAGDVKVAGNDPRIKIDGDTDSHPGLELYENGARKWIIYNNYTNDNLTFKTNSNTRMVIEQDGNVGIGTQSPASTLEVNGSFSKDIITITGTSNNVDATQSTVLMNAASGHCSAQLPAVAGTSGRIYTFKRIDSDESNGCKIQTNGSETIDGNSADYELDTQYNVLTIQSNGSAWYIINEVHIGHGG